MPQLMLFDEKPAKRAGTSPAAAGEKRAARPPRPPTRPHNGTATSRDAAERLTASAAELQRQAIVAFVRDHGECGATDAEIQAALGIDVNTERPRRRECVRGGRLAASGRTRPTASGRAATVWITAERPSW